MHDPMTVAFEIRYPWRAHRDPKNDFEREYRESFITVWHRDPEKNGDDDSCGWSYPEPPEDLVKKLESDLTFLCREDKEALRYQRANEGPQMWRLLWLQRASFWDRKKGLSARQIAGLLYADSFPGNREDTWQPSDDLHREAWIIARVYHQAIRPWWQHPRWHVWHWRLQMHPTRALKRWLFSRCSVCGKGFTWGYAPLSDSWHGTGPRWFRGERDVRHFDCHHPASAAGSMEAV